MNTANVLLSAFENSRYADAPAPACGKISSGRHSGERGWWNRLIHPSVRGIAPLPFDDRQSHPT
jgi:hypothetical protein